MIVLLRILRNIQKHKPTYIYTYTYVFIYLTSWLGNADMNQLKGIVNK